MADAETSVARILDRRTVLRGAKFDFEEVTLAGSDGQPLRRQFVRHPGAVVVLPVLETDAGIEIVFVRNARFAVGRRLLELPAGTLDAGEDAASCARRELIEETGYEPAEIEPIRSYYTTPGLTDELMHAFVARGLRQVGQSLEPDEDLTVERVEAGAALRAVESGELSDAKSMLALLLADRLGMIRVTE